MEKKVWRRWYDENGTESEVQRTMVTEKKRKVESFKTVCVKLVTK